MTYKVTVKGRPGRRIVEVAGEIDIAAREPLLAAARQAAVGGQVTLDVGRVSFLDSAGLGILIGLAKDDVTPVLRGASTQIRRLLEITGLEGIVTLEG